MNGESSTFTIGVIGFEKDESRVLQRVVGLSEHRQPTFGPFNKERGGLPHVIMVNADRQSALEKWNQFRRANAHRASFAPIFVSCQPTDLPCPDPYVLYRPILTTQLFSVLDQVVTEVHGYRPNGAMEAGGGLVALTAVEKEKALEAATALPDAMMPASEVQARGARKIDSGETSLAAETAALVVDDSLFVRTQVRGMLSSFVSRVDFADTAERAFNLIDTRAYSAIFVDAMLQDDDAYEICGRIKKHSLQQQATMVMLTSSASPAEQVMGMLAGFDKFLAKPIRRDTLSELAIELGRPVAI